MIQAVIRSYKSLIDALTLDTSKLKEFADDSLKFDENGRKSSEWVENTGEKEKLLVTSNFSFSQSVFKRLVLQTCKNQGLFWKGLTHSHTMTPFDASGK